MKYAYLKNGDAVAQVRRFMAGVRDRSGPDAFIGDFLTLHPDDDILVLCRSEREDREVAGRVTAEAIAAPSWIPMAGMRRVIAALEIAWRIFRSRPDRIICGCTMELFWFSTLVAWAREVPIVNSRHGGLPGESLSGRLKMLIERKAMRACRAVICHGPYLADGVRAAGINPKRVREFDVDLSDFGADIQADSIPSIFEQFIRQFPQIVMYVGRIQANKGVIDLFDAFSALPKTLEGRVGLVYIGEGVDLPALRKRLKATQVGRVLLLGKLPHGQLAPAMCKATVIAAPTQPQLPEGRCMVVLEALVLGVPVVAPDFAAFPYAVHDEVNGLLFEPGSVPALSTALTRIATDADLRRRLGAGAARSGQQLVANRIGFGLAIDEAFG